MVVALPALFAFLLLSQVSMHHAGHNHALLTSLTRPQVIDITPHPPSLTRIPLSPLPSSSISPPISNSRHPLHSLWSPDTAVHPLTSSYPPSCWLRKTKQFYGDVI